MISFHRRMSCTCSSFVSAVIFLTVGGRNVVSAGETMRRPQRKPAVGSGSGSRWRRRAGRRARDPSAPQKWVEQEGLAAPEAEVLSFLGRTHAPAFRAAAAALSELNSAAKCLRRLALRRSAACAAIHSRRRRRANGERAGFIGTPCMLIMQASAWPSAWLALRVLAGRQRGCCGRAEWGRAGNGAVGPRQCSSIFWLSLPLLLLPLPFLSLLLRA